MSDVRCQMSDVRCQMSDVSDTYVYSKSQLYVVKQFQRSTTPPPLSYTTDTTDTTDTYFEIVGVASHSEHGPIMVLAGFRNFIICQIWLEISINFTEILA